MGGYSAALFAPMLRVGIPSCAALAVACASHPAAEPLAPASAPSPIETIRYCDETVTTWDVDDCVFQFPAEQQKQRGSSYKLVFRDGKLLRREEINGLGFPVPPVPENAVWEFHYEDRLASMVGKDANGVIRQRDMPSPNRALFFWKDEAGRPRLSKESREKSAPRSHASGLKRVFDASGRVTSYWYVDVDGTPTESEAGATEVRKVRNPMGAVVLEEFFDGDGRPVFPADGAPRVVYARDPRGLCVEKRYEDAPDHPVARGDGVHSVKQTHDSVGNLVEVSFHAVDGQPVRAREDGAASYRIKRDVHGSEIERTYYDERGQPTVSAYGYVTRRKRLDEKGRPIEWSFFDGQGRPARGRAAYSIRRQTLDGRGRVLRERFFDEDGRPINLPAGNHSAEFEYDSRDNKTLSSYRDVRGNLVTMPDGYSFVEQVFDGDRIMRVRYLDAERRPVQARWGYAEIRFAYDRFGTRFGSKVPLEDVAVDAPPSTLSTASPASSTSSPRP